MGRAVLPLTAVSAAVVALFYTATSARGRSSPDAPTSSFRPFLQPGGTYDDIIQISPQAGSWQQRVPGPLHLRYSWLACDLEGKHCSPLPGPATQSIDPPQELR